MHKGPPIYVCDFYFMKIIYIFLDFDMLFLDCIYKVYTHVCSKQE